MGPEYQRGKRFALPNGTSVQGAHASAFRSVGADFESTGAHFPLHSR
jgi:hypothetical protein